jgi:hypothetical protein
MQQNGDDPSCETSSKKLANTGAATDDDFNELEQRARASVVHEKFRTQYQAGRKIRMICQ